ncbi:protein of unknown function [Paenibacillus alvei]|uniref:Uncharacterized protein n=1 Tax=Paenibacillus alvei TaxID=44250 RepID=A0A383REJ6_PAEAL|nr:protein of unknown function [Paenibacillus alvei]
MEFRSSKSRCARKLVINEVENNIIRSLTRRVTPNGAPATVLIVAYFLPSTEPSALGRKDCGLGLFFARKRDAT